MKTVEQETRDLVQSLDRMQSRIEWDEIAARADTAPVVTRPRPKMRRGWLVAASVGVVTLLLLGLVPLLLQGSNSSPADQPVPTTIIRPPWSLAIRLPDSAFPIGPRESFDDFVSSAAGWEGVEVVVLRSDTVQAWVEVLGEPPPSGLCDAKCDQGIVLFAHSDEALEDVYQNQLFGWWGTPRELVFLSSEGIEQLNARTADRATYLAEYIQSVSERRGPEPLFDTSEVGTEQELVAATSQGEVGGRLVVRISGTDITASLSFPLTGSIGPETAEESESSITLSGHSAHRLTASSNVRSEFRRISTDPELGLGVEIVDVIVWDGGIAFGIAGLPANSSVVATELPGGIRLWQVPVSGIAYFTAEGSYADYIAQAGAPPFTVYDSEGKVIHVNR